MFEFLDSVRCPISETYCGIYQKINIADSVRDGICSKSKTRYRLGGTDRCQCEARFQEDSFRLFTLFRYLLFVALVVTCTPHY